MGAPNGAQSVPLKGGRYLDFRVDCAAGSWTLDS